MGPSHAGKEEMITEAEASAAQDAICTIRSSLNEAKIVATRVAHLAVINEHHVLFDRIRAGVRQLEVDVIEEAESALARRDRKAEEEDDEGDEGGEVFDQASPTVSELRLVVDMLDPQLRHCLFCIAAFPKRQTIKKRLLIHWWIGEDAVRCASAGKRCFEELASRGLVVPVDTRLHCDRAHACTVHPLVHRYVKSAAKSSGSFNLLSGGDSKTYDRMLLHKAQRDSIAPRAIGRDKLMTLYNVSSQYVQLDKKWLAGQRAMRVLQLGQWRSSGMRHIEAVDTEFLDAAGRYCRNLTYLSLRGMSLIAALPDAISKLNSLVVLDMRACHNLEKLPPTLGALEMLEYLDVSGCHLLEQMPRSLQNLTRLEVLKGFVIAGMRTKGEPARLADLSRLPRLRKLSITVGHHASVMPEDDIEQQLGGCHALRVLTITWGSAAPATTAAPDVVSFPPGLEKLDLRRMPHRSPPRWFHPLTLACVKKLYIRGGAVESLGHGSGWAVETLRLRFLKNIRCEWAELQRAFPELRHVDHWECAQLGAWRLVTDERGVWMKAKDDAASRHADEPCPLAYYQFFVSCGFH